jgi:hypothetical protein
MNTRFLIVAVALMLVGGALADPLATKSLKHVEAFKPLGDDCDVCIGLISTDINILVNAIVEIGIEDGCGELCNFIPNGLEADICTLYCEVQGINAFSALLTELNPDPIAVCMAMKVCPVNNYARGKITSLTVSPDKGPQGTTFNINMMFQITNTTGTGQVLIQINPPGQNGQAFGQEGNFQALTPGNYPFSVQIQSQPNQDQPFNAGLYQVVGAICESTCGATNRFAYTIAEASTRFAITNN